MGGNTQMYYLNGTIDYNEIVTRLGRRSLSPLSRPTGRKSLWGEGGWTLYSLWSSERLLMLLLCDW